MTEKNMNLEEEYNFYANPRTKNRRAQLIVGSRAQRDGASAISFRNPERDPSTTPTSAQSPVGSDEPLITIVSSRPSDAIRMLVSSRYWAMDVLKDYGGSEVQQVR